ncbi:MAG: hypothetical protein OEY27_02715 [Gammaproteobacteria bacterium]|nr:hypothetical protein [Gammaproteobacteria bacterium]
MIPPPFCLQTRFCLIIAGLLAATTAAAGEWSGFVSLEHQGFFHPPLYPEQHRAYVSMVAQPEFYHRIGDTRDSFTFVPFARVDQHDPERSHVDIRELTWLKVGEGHEWRLGIRKVFWGVTESQHLVDIINQTDLVENIDTEDKLGQPMINFALIRDWGTLNVFVLPGFRERTFPGVEGRLRTDPRVDTDQASYESSRKRRHIDLALRWSNSFGGWDVGLSQFVGTSRDPRLLPGVDGNGLPALIPRYDQIQQTGLDVQLTAGSWLWKLETIRRRGQGPAYLAATGGFEYTFTGVFGTIMDLGVIAEYSYDDRGSAAPTPFQDDVMTGLRLAVNDAQSSEVLIGVINDRRSAARFFNLEAGRRLGGHYKLSLEARAFAGAPATDPAFFWRRDDYLQLELARYF